MGLFSRDSIPSLQVAKDLAENLVKTAAEQQSDNNFEFDERARSELLVLGMVGVVTAIKTSVPDQEHADILLAQFHECVYAYVCIHSQARMEFETGLHNKYRAYYEILSTRNQPPEFMVDLGRIYARFADQSEESDIAFFATYFYSEVFRSALKFIRNVISHYKISFEWKQSPRKPQAS